METIIVYDASGQTGLDTQSLRKYIKENKLPEKNIVATNADLLFALIEQTPQLALVIITQSLNTTPYRESAQAQQNQVLAELQEKNIPHELVDSGDVLTPTILSVLHPQI
jgi:hypothetical protein